MGLLHPCAGADTPAKLLQARAAAARPHGPRRPCGSRLVVRVEARVSAARAEAAQQVSPPPLGQGKGQVQVQVQRLAQRLALLALAL